MSAFFSNVAYIIATLNREKEIAQLIMTNAITELNALNTSEQQLKADVRQLKTELEQAKSSSPTTITNNTAASHPAAAAAVAAPSAELLAKVAALQDAMQTLQKSFSQSASALGNAVNQWDVLGKSLNK